MNPLRAVVGVISILLVVGVCIGLLAGVNNGGFDEEADEDDEKALSTTSKTVAAICKQTDYKHRCVVSICSTARNKSATPLDFVKAAINNTIHHVTLAKNNTANIIGKDVKNSTQKMALDDCDDLLQYAIDELQASLSAVDNSSVDTIQDGQAELKNWLSAVMSYHHTCLEGFANTPLFKPMVQTLINSTHLTSNALAIVSGISDILSAFGVPQNVNANQTSRRLMNSGYASPTWMSIGDRKLLASRNNANVEPNAIVAQDGSGRYKTIRAALAAYPKNLTERYVIYVKAGVYNENVTIAKDKVNVFMYGDGPRRTIVTGNKSYKNGIPTIRTASFSAIGDGFMAKSMGFQNTAGAIGHQAVALRVQSDRAALYNCRMDGYRNTLYQQTHRQFYRNCMISGTIDIIFGDAAAVVQNSLIVVRKPDPGQKNTITAHERADKHESTGLVIQNCRIVPDQKLFPVSSQFPSYLGRPRKPYSRTVIMESQIGGFIEPAGWLEWICKLYLNTLYFAEYSNRGEGANTSARVEWEGYHVLTEIKQARRFRAARFIQANQWLRTTGFPCLLGLKND
ncbi:hypothetical protein JCGZ_19087 [Jatropha curcas]|uniref:Pectinesterase n=1 Tax=Jatropha curcas TaxID=180498 RepID=A0A067JVT9_JATCU|nr:pectinesterase [Jatropha curcas]KDP28007.1 hypothetical protein JCGZ_19087 [Jatropha curcas]